MCACVPRVPGFVHELQPCQIFCNPIDCSPPGSTVHGTLPLLAMYRAKIKMQKDTSALVFTAALFTIARTQEQLKCPSTDE